MRDGIEYESLTGAGLVAGGVLWVLPDNLNVVVSGVLTVATFLVSFWLLSKFVKIYLKSEEEQAEEKIDKEWEEFFKTCVNEIGLDDTEKIVQETDLLIAEQRDKVSSVDHHIRVRDSLYEHINFQSLKLGAKLQLKREQNQRFSDIEIEQRLDYTVSKEVNDEDGVVVKMPKNSLLTTMEDRHQAVISEENYLHEYLQKLPKIDRVEKKAVLTSSSGHLRPDFIATNTQGERYIIELKIARTTGGVLDAERRVKEMFVAVGVEMIGSEVLGVGPLGTSIIFVGKAPSIEEE